MNVCRIIIIKKTIIHIMIIIILQLIIILAIIIITRLIIVALGLMPDTETHILTLLPKDHYIK